MLRRGLLSSGFALILAFALPLTTAHAQAASKPRNGAHVYLLRGFMGIFSLGMDELAEKLKRRGIPATVHSHIESSSLAGEASGKYKSGRLRNIVIVGHSLGATSAIDMAAELNEARVPVSLVVTFDPISRSTVTPNVRRLINYYVGDGVGATVDKSSKFRGVLNNIDQSRSAEIGHFNVDKSDALHRKVIGQIMATIGGGASSAAPVGGEPAANAVNQIGAGPATQNNASSSSAAEASAR